MTLLVGFFFVFEGARASIRDAGDEGIGALVRTLLRYAHAAYFPSPLVKGFGVTSPNGWELQERRVVPFAFHGIVHGSGGFVEKVVLVGTDARVKG